jgi:hypothetical protein
MRCKTVIFALLVSLSAFARPQMREVVRDSIVNAPLKDVLLTVDRFCYEFQACPDSLFDWAYLGLGDAEKPESSTKESRDVIQLRYKDRVYDPVNKTGDVAIDIYVLGVRWWKNQHLGSKYVLSRPAKSKYPLTAKMTATYSGSILESGTILMRMEPLSDTQTSVHYEFRLVFGKVLSTFIGDKTWQNAIQWRLSTIFDNLVEYAETGTVAPKEAGPRP